jgi:hypothetical protein
MDMKQSKPRPNIEIVSPARARGKTTNSVNKKVKKSQYAAKKAIAIIEK